MSEYDDTELIGRVNNPAQRNMVRGPSIQLIKVLEKISEGH